MAEYQNQLCVFTRGGINAKTVASTVIHTTEDGTQRFVPIYFIVEATAAASITDGPTISLGTNSSSYDNIASALDSGGTFIAANDLFGNAIVSDSIAANTDIRVNISAAATGTSMTIRVDLIGYYV